MENIDQLRIESIEQLRKEIIMRDKKILDLLAERSELAERIAKKKQKAGLSVIDEEREEQLREMWNLHAKKLGLNIKTISNIFEEVLNMSKQTQNNVIK